MDHPQLEGKRIEIKNENNPLEKIIKLIPIINHTYPINISPYIDNSSNLAPRFATYFGITDNKHIFFEQRPDNTIAQLICNVGELEIKKSEDGREYLFLIGIRDIYMNNAEKEYIIKRLNRVHQKNK